MLPTPKISECFTVLFILSYIVRSLHVTNAESGYPSPFAVRKENMSVSGNNHLTQAAWCLFAPPPNKSAAIARTSMPRLA